MNRQAQRARSRHNPQAYPCPELAPSAADAARARVQAYVTRTHDAFVANLLNVTEADALAERGALAGPTARKGSRR